MLDQQFVFKTLQELGVDLYTGVPDSYLNGFCNYALNHFPEQNIIAANEGNAIGIAAGHYFATKHVPLVYMQNSGMGNTVNPLASLADEDVYAVPMLLLIGWRGQGNTEPKHPQHKLQGEITPKLLEVLHIPYTVLEDDDEKIGEVLKTAVETAASQRKPYGLIAPKGVMAGEKGNNQDDVYPLSREEAIEIILENMPEDTIYSATTGRATRELYWLRDRRGEDLTHDFLNVGSMGHASSVALGIALQAKDRYVVTLDGDCAAIMHLGALTMVSKLDVPNFIHVVLNNGAHESVGGQPSAGFRIDFTKIAEACGYATVGEPVTDRESLEAALETLKKAGKASFIEVRIHKGLKGKLPPLDFDHRAAIDTLIEELNK